MAKRGPKLTPVTDIPAYAVIIRCIHERGESQAEALAELDRRRLWLSDEQKIQAGLALAPPKTKRQRKTCPACLKKQPGFTGDCGAGNAYSRYANVYICSGCGLAEALTGFFWRARCDTALIKPHHKLETM